MDEATALSLFGQLTKWKHRTEEETDEEDGSTIPAYEEPMFEVRLDAGSERDKRDHANRTWRLRVTPAPNMMFDPAWELVLQAAAVADVRPVIQNSGIELE